MRALYKAENEKVVRESDESGRTLLWASAHFNQPGIASLLINHKAKVNQSGGQGLITPLIEAAQNGFIEIVSLNVKIQFEWYWDDRLITASFFDLRKLLQ